MVAAIYCRLSKEDEEKVSESESIQNQKSMLIEYAAEKGWEIYNIYSDEDYSGADRDRPGFCNLIADARQGKFNIVLCKSQHRFTRDMELVEKYLHDRFLRWNIRFIALLDNADTDVKGNKKSRQMNGLINEWYLEDLSENVRAVFNHKRKNGQYIGSFPLFGYKKDPADKNKLIVDPAAAVVVRRIYALYLEGYGKQHITYMLNAEGTLNPTTYKQQALGLGYVNSSIKNDYGLWNKTTVGRILCNQMYTGDLVQGRKKKVSYKSKKRISLPKEQWFIAPDTHEPIINKETFAKVQSLMASRRRSDGTGQIHILAGKVKCMDCGSVMTKSSNKYKGERRSYLRCKLYATEKSLCSNHSIRLDSLENEIVKRIQHYIETYYDVSNVQNLITIENQSKHQDTFVKEIKRVEADIEKREKAVRQLYLDRINKEIDAEMFLSMSRAFIAEKKAFQSRLAALKNELENFSTKREEKRMEETRKKWFDINLLSRELITDFVESVEIGEKPGFPGEKQAIQINWMM